MECSKCVWGLINPDFIELDLGNIQISMNGKVYTVCQNNDPDRFLDFTGDDIICNKFKEKE